jgi:hypothetical protein
LVDAGIYRYVLGAAVKTLVVSGLTTPRIAGTTGVIRVTAKDASGNTATSYLGKVHFTSTDPQAVLPADYTFKASDKGTHTFSVTLKTAGTWSVTATDTVTAAIKGSQTGIVVRVAGSTYHPIAPVRFLDTRVGNGLSGKLTANIPRTFQITGRGAIPANVTAVTANVTVTNPTAGGSLYVGPVALTAPTTSSISFKTAETRANNLTIGLGVGGKLSATYVASSGKTTDLVFDVTGYFTPDTTGVTYHPLAPLRFLDSRVGNGLSGKLTANTPRSFQITGRGGVPSNATAVTGNVTVVNETNAWAIYLGPAPLTAPKSSTINFVTGEIKANGLTVALGAGGKLSATYISTTGNTTDLVFDVTGYYTAGTSGAKFVAITPVRLLKTSTGVGLSGKFTANTPRTVQITTRGGVPTTATGITGNLAVVAPTNAWAVFLGPIATAAPKSSTLNFNAGDVVANGITVALGTGGKVSATYISTAGNTTDLVLDVTGYFVP